jgi:hypothetical protein
MFSFFTIGMGISHRGQRSLRYMSRFGWVAGDWLALLLVFVPVSPNSCSRDQCFAGAWSCSATVAGIPRSVAR